jgi:predicted dinucleotide-binding enzyme
MEVAGQVLLFPAILFKPFGSSEMGRTQHKAGEPLKKVLFVLIYAAAMMFTAGCFAANQETVAVIGTGDMGDSLGPRFTELGYRVVYGSRNPASDRVKALVKSTGESTSAMTQREAAQQADIVLLAVPWPAMETVARNLGDLDGKIIIDVSMPFQQGKDGYPEHLLKTSSAEMIQDWNPGAKVVKTFATLGSQVIDDPLVEGGIVTLPIASDHRDAKEKVAGIVAAMGLDPVDFGPLRMSRDIEIMQMIYMIPLTQGRPQNWEFYFRRSDHYGCYMSGEATSEGIAPVYDAGDLAVFPHTGGTPAPCPE